MDSDFAGMPTHVGLEFLTSPHQLLYNYACIIVTYYFIDHCSLYVMQFSELNAVSGVRRAGEAATSHELHSRSFMSEAANAAGSHDSKSSANLAEGNSNEWGSVIAGSESRKRLNHASGKEREQKKRKCRCLLLSCIFCNQQGLVNPEIEMQDPSHARPMSSGQQKVPAALPGVPSSAPLHRQQGLPTIGFPAQQRSATPRVPAQQQLATPRVPAQQQSAISGVQTQQQSTTSEVAAQQQSATPRVPAQQQSATPGVPAQQQSATPRVPAQQQLATPRVPAQQQSAISGVQTQQQSTTSGVAAQQQSATPRVPAQQQSATPGVPAQQQSATPRVPAQQQSATPRVPAQQQSATPGVPAQQQSATSVVQTQQQSTTSRVPAQQQSATPRVPAQQQSATPRVPAQQQSATPRVPAQQQSATPRVPAQQQSATPGVPAQQQSATPRVPAQQQSAIPGVTAAPHHQQLVSAQRQVSGQHRQHQVSHQQQVSAQLYQQQVLATTRVPVQHHQPPPVMQVQALPYTPPFPGLLIPTAAYMYSVPSQQIPRVGYPMGVPIPIQRVSSITLPRPGVYPPGVQQVLAHTIPPGSQIPGTTGPHVAQPVDTSARGRGQPGEWSQLTSTAAVVSHPTILSVSEHGIAKSTPTSSTQAYSDVQVSVTANNGPSELSPSTRTHDVIHEGELYSRTEPNSSGVTGEVITNKQVQGRNNGLEADTPTNAEAAAPEAANEVGGQAMNQTVHTVTEGTAQRMRKRPGNITFPEGKQAELEGSIQLELSPHEKHGMPVPTEMVRIHSPFTKNHLARIMSESPETITPIQPKKQRPATYTEGVCEIPEPPQHSYGVAQSFQREGILPQLKCVPSYSETKVTSDLKLQDRGHTITTGVEDVFCHTTAEVGDSQLHAPTWVDEEESAQHKDYDDVLPTNVHAASAGTRTQSQKRGKKVAKKGHHQNAPKGKRSSKIPHTKKEGQKKKSRDSGITWIDDVAPEKGPHTPDKKSTSCSEMSQVVVEHHSGENADVDNKITWVDADEPVSRDAGETKQQQQQQRQHQPPTPSPTLPPATVTEGMFEERVVNNPIFTPQPLEFSDHSSERVKPLQDAQQQVETKSSKNTQSRLSLVHVEKAVGDRQVRGSETSEGSTKLGRKCPLLSCLLCSKQDHSGLAFHSSMDSIDMTPERTTIPAEMRKEEKGVVVIPPPAAATITPPQSSSQQHIPAAFGGRTVNNPIFSPEIAPAAPVSNVVTPTQPANYYPPSNAVPWIQPANYCPQTPATQPMNYYPQTAATQPVNYYPQNPATNVPQSHPVNYYPPTQCYSPAPPQYIVGNTLQVNNQHTTTAATLQNVGTNKIVGYTPPKLRKRQKEAREPIFNKMKGELQKPSSDHGEEYNCCQCTDTCFQAFTCSMPNCNIFGRSKTSTPPVKQEPLLPTEVLRRGRTEGLKDFWAAVLPLFTRRWRVMLVVIEFILVIVGLLLSIISLSLDENRGFNIAHLLLAILSALLATIDFVYALKSFCCEDSCTCDTDSSCCSCWNNFFDFSRLILSEGIFYPLLICDIFEVIVGRGFEQTGAGDIVGIVLFVISLISMIITVYIARIVLLVAMVINANNVRTPDTERVLNDQTLPGEHDPEIRQSAVRYQLSFCVHTILQMLAQILAYIAIAAKIRYDNRHFYRIENTDKSIHVSSFLWYMIIAGYVTPILGHLSFFIVTYHWGQEYPIGYHIDMMRIFQMT